MADEEQEINNSEQDEEKKPRIDQRIEKLLTDKTKAEEGLAKADKAREKAQAEAEAAKKDLEFFKNFNTVSSKYQGASEYQDQIKEKTALGLDIEEATMLVLAKEGKYTPPQAPRVPQPSPAGGSATTTLRSPEKPLNEMSQAERRAALIEAEKRGDLGLN